VAADTVVAGSMTLTENEQLARRCSVSTGPAGRAEEGRLAPPSAQKVVAELLGHSAITMTNRCSHLAPGAMRSAVAMAEAHGNRTMRRGYRIS
jgi:hypothetical protein